jgi:MFS family permease
MTDQPRRVSRRWTLTGRGLGHDDAPADFRVVAIAALSGAIEYYNFVIFVFLSPVMVQLFFPSNISPGLAWLQTIGIFIAGYLARPLGGIVVAHYGDLFGRKRAFAFSILLMSLSTLSIGLMPTYFAIGAAAPIILMVLRIMQGFAIGGEIPGAWTLVAEHLPRRHVGLACGLVCSGLGLGILSGSLVVASVNWFMTPQEMLAFGWRLPFLVGGVLGILAFYLRRRLRESPVFRHLARNPSLMVVAPFATVLRMERTSVLISMALTWVLAAAVLMTTLFTPILLQRFAGYGQVYALTLACLGLSLHVIGCGLAGMILDRIRLDTFLIWGGILFGLATFAFFTNLSAPPEIVALLYALMGLSSGLVSAVPCAMVQLFPAAVRFTGISFSYNVAYAVFGPLTTSIAAATSVSNPLLHAHYMLVVSAVAVAIGIYFRKAGVVAQLLEGARSRT